MTTTEFITVLGAAGLGFVLGWTLYFANRGKSGEISTSDLAAIAAVIAGGAIAELMGDKASETVSHGLIFGGYGIGLFAGFAASYIMLRKAMRDDAGAGLENARSAPVMRGPGRPGSSGIVLRQPAATAASEPLKPADTAVLLTQLQAAKTALEALMAELAPKKDAAEQAGDTDTADEIGEQLATINALLVEINRQIALISLTGPTIISLLAVVGSETTKLEEEAERMKEITEQIAKVAAVFEALGGLLTTLRKLAR